MVAQRIHLFISGLLALAFCALGQPNLLLPKPFLTSSLTNGLNGVSKLTKRCARSIYTRGRVAEWLNAPVLKTGIGASLSGVRIPPRPPLSYI